MRYRYETADQGDYSLLKGLAKQNRKHATQAESLLWEYLRGKKLGERFRRQHPINNFIVDFVCINKNLIIEVDGGYHLEPDVVVSDEERTRILEEYGFAVLRFENDEVIANPEMVINKIKAFMTNNENSAKVMSPLLGRGRGRLLIFSAPSGSGKSTIVQWLMTEHPELNLHFSISCTTRAPRGTEQNGVEYFFLTPDEFRAKIAQDAFVEYEEVYTDKFYGTLKSQVEAQTGAGENVTFDVDVKGGCNIKRQYGNRAMSIFIQPPSIDELRRRLVSRATDAPDVIEQRLAKAEYEMTFAPQFDHVVVNDDLEVAKEEVFKLICDFIKG